MEALLQRLVVGDHNGARVISNGSESFYVRAAATQAPWHQKVYWDRELAPQLLQPPELRSVLECFLS